MTINNVTNRKPYPEIASIIPFGLGHNKPHHYKDMGRVLYENRDNLPYAWKILKHGVCDGCSLGPYGFRDNVIDGIHLCMSRLNLLRINTMPAFDINEVSDIQKLRSMSLSELQWMGRIPYPLIYHKGDRGFQRISWNEALKIISEKLTKINPYRIGFFATSRGIVNESYYLFQKLVRMLGSNNVDLCSRLCHAASVYGLKETLGFGAPTCSLSDMIGTDLLCLFGTDMANNQPVTTKYMYYAKQKGTRIIVINPFREPGLERYWVPSVTKSSIFGTKLMDHFFQVNVGGDIAFVNGILKYMLEKGWTNQSFINNHTIGFDKLKETVTKQSWLELEKGSGLNREKMFEFAELYNQSKSSVFVYSMGLTQHQFGVNNVKAIVNLALSRGMVGQEKCGIIPIRGHSGVQGGGECGVDTDKFPGGADINEINAFKLSEKWGKQIPAWKGIKTPMMIESAYRGELDLLYSFGGNLLETLPDRNYVKEALSNVPLRIHQDIVFNTSTVLEGDMVIVLPSMTRYESGGTSTSTERRIRYSPKIPGQQIGEARADWDIFADIGRQALPSYSKQFDYTDDNEIRKEISNVIPIYKGIEKLSKEGDSVQWGGPYLYKDWKFEKMPNGRAIFSPLTLPNIDIPKGFYYLTTRRGKQFNSMPMGNIDNLVGTNRRDIVFISQEDADQLKLKNTDPVILKSSIGEFHGICQIGPIKPNNIQMYWPESNVLIGRRYDPISGEPDYNCLVQIITNP